MRIAFDVTETGVGASFNQMLDRLERPRPLLEALGQMLVAGAKRRFRAGGDPTHRWPESARARREGGQTLVDSGRLRRSLHYRVLGRRTVAVGSDVRYAGVHQRGAVIRPRRADRLAVPFPGIKGSPRDFSDTFVRAGGARGTPVLFQRTDDGVRPLFSLVSSVRIPARPFVRVGDWERQQVADLVRWHVVREG